MPKIASVPSATSVFPALMAPAAISLALLGPQNEQPMLTVLTQTPPHH
jgi:hypothetical protein